MSPEREATAAMAPAECTVEWNALRRKMKGLFGEGLWRSTYKRECRALPHTYELARTSSGTS